MDQKAVRKLETEIEASLTEIIFRLGLRQLPLQPSQQTMHLMAKAAVTVYEAAVENQDPRASSPSDKREEARVLDEDIATHGSGSAHVERKLVFGWRPRRPASGNRCVATLEDFEKIDIRVGIVIEAKPYSQGTHSTHILKVDFGDGFGVRKSLARLAPNYDGPELIGRPLLCVVNFPPRQVGRHLSEVLTLGVPDEKGNVVLLRPEVDVPLGGRLY